MISDFMIRIVSVVVFVTALFMKINLNVLLKHYSSVYLGYHLSKRLDEIELCHAVARIVCFQSITDAGENKKPASVECRAGQLYDPQFLSKVTNSQQI